MAVYQAVGSHQIGNCVGFSLTMLEIVFQAVRFVWSLPNNSWRSTKETFYSIRPKDFYCCKGEIVADTDLPNFEWPNCHFINQFSMRLLGPRSLKTTIKVGQFFILQPKFGTDLLMYCKIDAATRNSELTKCWSQSTICKISLAERDRELSGGTNFSVVRTSSKLLTTISSCWPQLKTAHLF